MKKCFAIVLPVLLFLSLTACGNQTPQTPVLTAAAGDVYTTYPQVHITRAQPTVEDGKITLTLQIQNDSEYVVTYGEAFTVLRQENDEWVKCTLPENHGFHEIAYLLEAGKNTEKAYCVTVYEGVDRPGTYRLKTDVYIDDGQNPNQNTRGQLWADFTVTQ